MSRKFTPLSTGVAAATATLILGIAGCAMNSQPASTTDQTDTAGLSRESTDNSQAPVVAQADTSAMPAATASPATDVTPAAVPAAEPAPVTTTAMANDGATVPLMDQPPAAGTPTYPSSTASTDTSASTPSASSTTVPGIDANTTPTSDRALPPRSDRN
jgi:hypothetical protein